MGPRERIIEKALILFYLQGANNTGINQIIKESGVAKASFYDHFSSKDDLVIECTKTYSALLIDKLQSYYQKSGSMREFFQKWIHMTKKAAENKTMYNGCPIANISFAVDIGDEKFKVPFTEIMDEWFSTLSQVVSRAIEKKEIAQKTDPLKAAKRILHIYEGALTMWKMTGDISFIDDLEDMLITVIA